LGCRIYCLFYQLFHGPFNLINTMRNRVLILLFLATCMFSCKPDLGYEIRGYTEKIIVEGSIDLNGYPSVYLSLNVPLWQAVDSATILDKVIRNAKVTVSEGENSEILYSRWDKSHFPPYVYRGSKIKGEAGKTYHIKVEYSGVTIQGSTTIPQRPNIKKFSFLPVENNDSLRILTVSININPGAKNGFRVYSLKQKDGVYLETPTVFNSSLELEGMNEFKINPEAKSHHPSYSDDGYFIKGDTVFVKICALDSFSSSFFNIFSMSAGLTRDASMEEIKELPTNISEPGFGIWYGSAPVVYRVIIE
jgi:hypothetical protein